MGNKEKRMLDTMTSIKKITSPIKALVAIAIAGAVALTIYKGWCMYYNLLF